MAAADGDWVHFLAGDDFVRPDFYRRSLELAEQYPECGLCSAYVQDVDMNGALQGDIRTPAGRDTAGYISPHEVVERLYRVGSWFEGVSCLLKRTSLERIGGFDPQLQGVADAFCYWTISAREGACFIPEVLAFKRDVWKGCGFGLYSDSANAQRIWYRVESLMRNQSPRLFPNKAISRFKKRWEFEQKHNLIMNAYLRDCNDHHTYADIKKYILTKVFEIYLKPFDVVASIENKMRKVFGGA